MILVIRDVQDTCRKKYEKNFINARMVFRDPVEEQA